MLIEIGNKQYNVKVADTDEEKENGLMNVESLRPNEGMLFVFDKEREVSF